MRLLSIPLDFVQRDEVRRLALIFSREFPSAVAAQEAAELLALRLWLDWARGGKPHRPYVRRPHGSASHAPVASDDPLTEIIALAVGWSDLNQILGLPDHPDSAAVRFAIESGLLIEEAVGGAPGLTLAGFAECNAHLHPNYESQYRKGPRVKAQLAALRAASGEGEKAKQLLAQQGFAFPSEEPSTTEEQNATHGFLLQLYVALDLPLTNREGKSVTLDWSDGLKRDTLHIIRSEPPARLEQTALWIMQNRAELPDADPAFIITNFATYAAKVPA